MSRGRGRSKNQQPQNIPKKVQRTIANTHEHTIEQKWQGPLPPPRILKEFNEIDPEMANRIVSMAENESKHRHDCEKRHQEMQAEELRIISNATNADILRSKIGQIFGLIITLADLTLIGYCVYSGNTTVASILGGTTIIGLAAIFVLGKYMDKSDE